MKEELSCFKGIVLRGACIVPQAAHKGKDFVKIKQCLCTKVWCPGVDRETKLLVTFCYASDKYDIFQAYSICVHRAVQ